MPSVGRNKAAQARSAGCAGNGVSSRLRSNRLIPDYRAGMNAGMTGLNTLMYNDERGAWERGNSC